MESTARDVDVIFNHELARKAFQSFKKVSILGDADGVVLDIIRLEGVGTATVEVLTRNVLDKDQDDPGESVVANYDFFRGRCNDVNCVESAESSQTSTDARQKLYWKEG